ncbi:PO113 protein, partial [Xiphorhynchus elegans]|nr:PO113 protein [Xiphorhynchus elegans]
EPAKRFQWTVLPQGMKNSPTICQTVIATLLSAVRRSFPDVILYHYMDDILIASSDLDLLHSATNSVLQILKTHNFEISSEKIQSTAPWQYLGWKISNKTIRPIGVSLNQNVKTLNDLQSLLGSINWIRPNLGITTDDLQPLFSLLKGNPDLNSPRSLTAEAKRSLTIVQQKLASPTVTRKWNGFPPIAVADFSGNISVHLPRVPLLQFVSQIQLYPNFLCSPIPLKHAMTVFTDGSGKTNKAVVCWRAGEQWKSNIHLAPGSPQLVELSAVCRALHLFPGNLNIISDSFYVVGIVRRIEYASVKDVSNPLLASLLQSLSMEIHSRTNPFFICHTRSHTTLPGPIAEGNAVADLLVSAAIVPNRVEQARLSHEFFHQGAKALRRSFGLSFPQARAIVSACGDCQQVAPLAPGGVNPRGLSVRQVWQMDVTQFPSFGRLKHIHVSIDTFSGLMVATAHAGEKARDVKKHLSHAFAIMGVPEKIKTDNGPAYMSNAFKVFLDMWGVQHVTGIPHSSTGQAIVERAHRTLKNMLLKQ